jgi:hypothetical protein
MDYEERYSDADLQHIVNEGLIYMCACPAQVADAIRKIRELYRYQDHCLKDPGNAAEVHRTIAQSAILAHSQLQDCLDQVLVLEQWDRSTLNMPANLRVRQAKAMLSD